MLFLWNLLDIVLCDGLGRFEMIFEVLKKSKNGDFVLDILNQSGSQACCFQDTSKTPGKLSGAVLESLGLSFGAPGTRIGVDLGTVFVLPGSV